MCARSRHPLAIVPLVLLAALVPSAQAQFICENCEDNGQTTCWSASYCENKLVGSYCGPGSIRGKCVDVNHPDCVDEPGESCCGCDFAVQSAGSEVFDPPAPVPDGDPAGWQSTIFVGESIPFDFVDVAVFANHAAWSELSMTLRHGGLEIILLDRPLCDVSLDCGSALALSDIAVGPAHCLPEDCPVLFPGGSPLADASYYPLEALAVFSGIDSFGEWTLTVIDWEPGDPGEVCSWELLLGDETTDIESEQELSWGVIKALYR